METDARRRLLEAVEQARAQAEAAVSEIRSDPDASRAIESAVRDAQETLARVAEGLKNDG